MTDVVYTKAEIDAIIAALPGVGSGEFWFFSVDSVHPITNLVNRSNVADILNGNVDVDVLYPGLVPANAKSLIITHECGWIGAGAPGGQGVVELRIMPHGFTLANMLDIAKAQEWEVAGGAVDVQAQQTRVPIAPGKRDFNYFMQSNGSNSSSTNKMVIIDLWGYTY